MMKDALHVVHARAAGLDIHKMEITSTVRLCDGPGDPVCETKAFSALPEGLEALAAWLTSHDVTAVAMEGTGIYWRAPWDRLRTAGQAATAAARRVPQCIARLPALLPAWNRKV